MALSFIPCTALPQVALADDTVSGEATVFTVYTTDSDGSNQQVAKAYTQAELEAPVDSSADAIDGQYVKGGSMGVWTSGSYVTFADLLANAGAAWGAGGNTKWGGTSEKPGDVFVYEQLQGRQFLPAAAVDKETGEITFFSDNPFTLIHHFCVFLRISLLLSCYVTRQLYILPKKPIKRRQGSITWKP